MACEPSCKYVCSVCGVTPLKHTAKFCSKCGKQLVLKKVCIQERVPHLQKCALCQKELEPDEAFCGDCGSRANATNSTIEQSSEGDVTGSSSKDTTEQGKPDANDPETSKRSAIL